jgi:dihydropyrimidine dehydrogenase (NAD+) subunit PreT
MTNSPFTPGIASGRLDAEALDQNFADLHPPLDGHEALVAADRCYFCHDAPCITACPTSIDIPLFIRQIATGTPEAAAKTIFDQNILGGMCARVCPTETLCEEACVREAAEGKPVRDRPAAALRHRHADGAGGASPYARAASHRQAVAVVGAGPAGLACAHRLAMHGHDVFDLRGARQGRRAQRIRHRRLQGRGRFRPDRGRLAFQIGGITVETGKALGPDLTLGGLRGDFDAVFLGMGLSGVNALRANGETREGVADAVDFISELRQAGDLGALPVGRNVVVIGGGMTAIDAAVQSKLLGAESVTIVYRRGRDAMPASRYEQDLAASKGVRIVFNAMPVEILGNGAVTGCGWNTRARTANR